MRIMASDAVPLGAGVLHLGRLDLLSLFLVAGHADGLSVCLRQHHLTVLRRRMTGVATAALKRHMGKRLHQLGLRRLVRIVALDTVGRRERLPLVGLDQIGRARIVTVQAQCRWRLGEVVIKLDLALLADLVGHVARLATHVQGRVTTALLGHIEPLVVTGEAKVVGFTGPGCGQQQLILVIGSMRAVTFEAVAHCWRMDRTLQISGIHIGVACYAERLWSRCDELDPGNILVHPNFVTARATGRDGGMNKLSLRFVLVTLNALG